LRLDSGDVKIEDIEGVGVYAVVVHESRNVIGDLELST